ncbi:MAG: hypothetical protein H7841_05040 [Magnetospirillum sp. WYHS-4]
MPRPLAFALALFAAIASPDIALAEDLVCADEKGPLLVAGSAGARRIEVVGVLLQLERWAICFTCAGLPNLRLDLRNSETGKTEAWVGAPARPHGDADTAFPERYSIKAAGVQLGSREIRNCRFPEGTTLGRLWTVLTGSAPPANVRGWWVFQDQ